MMKLVTLALLAGAASAQITTLPPTTTTGQIYYTGQPQIYYTGQPQYVVPGPVAPVIPGPPAGQQYQQYKIWAGKACFLIDLTTSPDGSVKTKGFIVENDLNGELSCETSVGTSALRTAISTAHRLASGSTRTEVSCNVALEDAASESLKTQCYDNEFLLAGGVAALKLYEVEATRCMALKEVVASYDEKRTAARVLNIQRLAKCDREQAAIW